MIRLFVLVGASVAGWLGWKLAERFGPFPAYFASVLGTAVGVVAGRRFAERLLP